MTPAARCAMPITGSIGLTPDDVGKTLASATYKSRTPQTSSSSAARSAKSGPPSGAMHAATARGTVSARELGGKGQRACVKVSLKPSGSEIMKTRSPQGMSVGSRSSTPPRSLICAATRSRSCAVRQ